MPIYKGEDKTENAYKGDVQLARIYKGDALVYENYKTLTAEGIPPITLSNCKNTNMLGYKVYGDSKQQTKNLLDIQTAPRSVIVGATITNSDNGVKIVATTANTSADFATSIPSLTPEQQYTISFTTQRSGTTGGGIRLYVDNVMKVNALNLSAGNYNYTFTAGENVVIYFYGASNSGAVGDYAIFTNVQLEKGSSSTSYEPAIPSPYGELAIESVGDKIENLFDKNNYSYYLGYIASARNNLVNYNLNMMAYIPCKPNTTYTISGNGSQATTTQIAYTYDTPADNVIAYGNVQVSDTKATITTNANARYLIFYVVRDADHAYTTQDCINKANQNVTNLQIVEGTTPIDAGLFGKYKIPILVNNTPTNIYLNEPLRKIGTYADYIDFETQKVVRNIKKNILSTSLPNFTFTSGYDNTYYTTFFYYAENRSTTTFPISNYFAPITTGSGYGPDVTRNGLSIDQSTYNIYFKIEKAIATNSAELTAWLATLSDPVEILYPSTVSTQESVVLPSILLNKGTNVVSVGTTINASNIWIKYKGK